MDNDQLAKIISTIGIVKLKYIGSFPADMIPEIFPPDLFLYATPKAVKD